ncbi:hypothetical protein J5J83_07685 [Azoarcus sp. L1K30]|uniref:contractile injection system protein, VgrG/Pvc8 family n=1 Tax=Azoarcus sp. L1K30 TaxID=2820277 RepID=UPI001B822CC2|nr:contractile injection system protein, VgrG/Pvc8 family [Azoarcus sp. L1K30]MBR0565993.1 hypothetical protein [Azoarcus sp. L1K30]
MIAPNDSREGRAVICLGDILIRPAIKRHGRADFRIWQNKTVPDIVSQVLGENAVRFDVLY